MEVNNDYYRNDRSELLPFILKGPWKVLDVGCGEGLFGDLLKKKGYANELVGIECEHSAAEAARGHLYDRVYAADLNRTGIDEVLSAEECGSFDYIFCNDILEHLIDPWNAVRVLRNFLKQKGRLVVSIPNVRHRTVWGPLLFQGKWDYRSSGILDQTHLRFFTRSSAAGLLSRGLLKVVQSEPLIRGKSRIINKCLLGMPEEFLAEQYVFIGMRCE